MKLILDTFDKHFLGAVRALAGAGLITLFLALMVPHSAAGSQLVDRIVAVVNNEIITFYDLSLLTTPHEQKIRNLGQTPDKEREMLFKMRQEALNQMIDQAITEQAIQKAEITVSEREIDQSVEQLKKANFLTQEDLIAALAREGMTLADYRERLRKEFQQVKLVNQEVKSKIVVTTEDIKAYYARQIDQYADEKEFHLRHILLRKPPRTDPTRNEARRATLAQIQADLTQGADFSELARRHSESPLAEKGGDLGFFKPAELADPIRSEIEKLSPGMATPILETEQGYQLFYVEAIKILPGKSLEAASAEIEQIIYQQKVEDRFNAWLTELRQNAHIRIML